MQQSTFYGNTFYSLSCCNRPTLTARGTILKISTRYIVITEKPSKIQKAKKDWKKGCEEGRNGGREGVGRMGGWEKRREVRVEVRERRELMDLNIPLLQI